MITNDMLSAYIDGELAPEEMERVARAIAADELLAARLEQFRRVDRLLTEFSSAIDAQPLPPAVLALLEPPCADDDAAARAAPRAVVLPLTRRPLHRRRVGRHVLRLAGRNVGVGGDAARSHG